MDATSGLGAPAASPAPAARATIIHVAGALFSGEGKLLLLERASAAEGGSAWDLPGGSVEFGEPPEVALMRAFAEGVDIEVVPDRPLNAWSELRRESGRELHIVHIDYVVRATGALTGVDVDRARYRAFAWLPRQEALARLGTPALQAVGERAFAMLSRARRNG